MFHLEISSKEDYQWYRNDQWTKKSFDQKIEAVKSKDWNGVGGAYGGVDTRVLHDTIDLYKDRVVGKRVLVIGSETPWVESILLALGAEHVTTLEYNGIVSTHPQVSTNLNICTCYALFDRNFFLTQNNSFHCNFEA